MSLILETEYWSTAADESLPLSLTLSSSGATKFWIRSNRDDSEKAVVGYFEGVIPAGIVSEVNAAVASAEFSAIANPSRVVPGETVRKITVRKATGPEQMRYVGEEARAPAAFAKAETAFLKSIEEAIRYPSLAIGFRADSLPSETVAGEEIGMDFHILNPGRQSLVIAAPESWIGSETEVTAKGIRTDIPLARLDNSHAPSVAIGPGNFGPGVPESPDGKLILEPGTSLRIPIRLRLAWEPGAYDFQITIESNLMDAHGKVQTRFEWVSPKSRLAVK